MKRIILALLISVAASVCAAQTNLDIKRLTVSDSIRVGSFYIRPNDVPRWNSKLNPSDTNALRTAVNSKLEAIKQSVTTTVSGLRTLNNIQSDVPYQTTDYGGGAWYYDPADNTSTDNTATVVVNGSKRLKRIYSGSKNILWYGTDRVSINLALSSLKSGESLYFPNGIYNIDAVGLIMANKSNVTIYSDGATIRQTAASSRFYLDNSMGSTGFLLSQDTSCVVRGFKFDGNGFSNAIAMSECITSTIESNEVFSCNSVGQIISVAGHHNKIIGNKSHDAAGANGTGTCGIYVGNTNSLHHEYSPTVNGNYSYNNTQDGIAICGEDGVVNNNYTYSNFGSGIIMAGAHNVPTKNISLTNNHSYSNGWFGIQSDIFSANLDTSTNWTRNATLTGNVCNSNGLGGIYAVGAMYWKIQDNTTNDNVGQGIDLTHAMHISIINNTVCDTRNGVARTQTEGIRVITQVIRSKSFDIDDIKISSNTAVNNISSNIFVANVGTYKITGLDINHNRTDSSGYGIFIAETAPNLINSNVNSNYASANTTYDAKLSASNISYQNNKFSTTTGTTAYIIPSRTTVIPITDRVDYYVNNDTATTVTLLSGGIEGQIIRIRNVAGNSNTIFRNDPGNLVMKGGLDVTMPQTSSYFIFQKQESIWREISRNFDAFSGQQLIGYGTIGDVLVLGNSVFGGGQRKNVIWGKGGFAQPGAYGVNSDGDKITLINSSEVGFDSRIGYGGNYDVWLKAVSSGGSGKFNVFTGSNVTTPMLSVLPTSVTTNGSVAVTGGLSTTTASTIGTSALGDILTIGTGVTGGGQRKNILHTDGGWAAPGLFGVNSDGDKHTLLYSANAGYDGRIGINALGGSQWAMTFKSIGAYGSDGYGGYQFFTGVDMTNPVFYIKGNAIGVKPMTRTAFNALTPTKGMMAFGSTLNKLLLSDGIGTLVVDDSATIAGAYKLKSDSALNSASYSTRGQLQKGLDSLGSKVSYGSYTPTLTNTLNISSSVVIYTTYTKIGNVIHVSITGSVDPTASSGATELTFTLPIACTNGLSTVIGLGNVSVNGGTSYAGGDVLLITTTTAKFRYINSLLGSSNFHISMDYNF